MERNLVHQYHYWKESFINNGDETLEQEEKLLIPLGYTSRVGDGLYWKINGEPENWPIVLWNMAYGVFQEYSFQTTPFVVQILTNQIILPQAKESKIIDYYREHHPPRYIQE